jgi:hypothetical protein
MCDAVENAIQIFGSVIFDAQSASAKLLEMPSVCATSQLLKSGDARAIQAAVAAAQAAADAGAAGGCKKEKSPEQFLMQHAMLSRRHLNLLRGATAVLQDAHSWLLSAQKAALDVGSSKVTFVAGDAHKNSADEFTAPPVLVVPNASDMQGPRLLRTLRSVERAHRPSMRQVVATQGWPEHIASRLGGASAEGVDKSKACRVCARQWSSMWLHRGVICCECEADERSAGRCPSNHRCKKAWFCGHDLRCFVCDEHSCDECRLQRGDASVVAELAARIVPGHIALDFDRTVASTKAGGAPEVGKHTIDEELCALMWEHKGKVSIVTRNSHREDINAFLAAHGAPPGVPVHVVNKKMSKADFVCPNGSDAEAILFVDDSIAELVDPQIMCRPNIHRVLFVRAL